MHTVSAFVPVVTPESVIVALDSVTGIVDDSSVADALRLCVPPLVKDHTAALSRPSTQEIAHAGRGGAAGGGERARRLARPIRDVPAAGRPGRLHLRQRFGK